MPCLQSWNVPFTASKSPSSFTTAPEKKQKTVKLVHTLKLCRKLLFWYMNVSIVSCTCGTCHLRCMPPVVMLCWFYILVQHWWNPLGPTAVLRLYPHKCVWISENMFSFCLVSTTAYDIHTSENAVKLKKPFENTMQHGHPSQTKDNFSFLSATTIYLITLYVFQCNSSYNPSSIIDMLSDSLMRVKWLFDQGFQWRTMRKNIGLGYETVFMTQIKSHSTLMHLLDNKNVRHCMSTNFNFDSLAAYMKN